MTEAAMEAFRVANADAALLAGLTRRGESVRRIPRADALVRWCARAFACG